MKKQPYKLKEDLMGYFEYSPMSDAQIERAFKGSDKYEFHHSQSEKDQIVNQIKNEILALSKKHKDFVTTFLTNRGVPWKEVTTPTKQKRIVFYPLRSDQLTNPTTKDTYTSSTNQFDSDVRKLFTALVRKMKKEYSTILPNSNYNPVQNVSILKSGETIYDPSPDDYDKGFGSDIFIPYSDPYPLWDSPTQTRGQRVSRDTMLKYDKPLKKFDPDKAGPVPVPGVRKSSFDPPGGTARFSMNERTQFKWEEIDMIETDQGWVYIWMYPINNYKFLIKIEREIEDERGRSDKLSFTYEIELYKKGERSFKPDPSRGEVDLEYHVKSIDFEKITYPPEEYKKNKINAYWGDKIGNIVLSYGPEKVHLFKPSKSNISSFGIKLNEMKENQLRKLIRAEITKLNESFQGELEIIASESDTLDTFKQKAKEYGYGDVPDDELEMIWNNLDKASERPVFDLGPIQSNESVNDDDDWVNNPKVDWEGVAKEVADKLKGGYWPWAVKNGVENITPENIGSVLIAGGYTTNSGVEKNIGGIVDKVLALVKESVNESINYLPSSFKANKTIKYKDKIIDSGYWTKGLDNDYTSKNTGKTEYFTVEDFQFFEKHIPSDLWITKDPGDYSMMNEGIDPVTQDHILRNVYGTINLFVSDDNKEEVIETLENFGVGFKVIENFTDARGEKITTSKSQILTNPNLIKIEASTLSNRKGLVDALNSIYDKNVMNEGIGTLAGVIVAGLSAVVLGAIAGNVGGSLDKLVQGVEAAPENISKAKANLTNATKSSLGTFLRKLPIVGPRLKRKDQERALVAALKEFIETEDGKRLIEALMRDEKFKEELKYIISGGTRYAPFYNLIQKYIKEMDNNPRWELVSQKFFNLRRDLKKDKYTDLISGQGDTMNEVFEWWHPLVSLGGAIALGALPILAMNIPGRILNPGALAPGDSWGDLFRHYKKKFEDKKAAKNLTNEDVLELIDLIQTGMDSSDSAPGVKRYMKGLMNKLKAEMNKDEEELDKNELLRLYRDVQNYSERIKSNQSSNTPRDTMNENLNETKMKKSYLKDIIREAYLELKEEDDEGIEDDIDVDEDEFDEEPPVDQDKESKTQEEAPKKRIDFEGKELEMLVDVNRNPTKKGLKIQFLSDEELSKEERAKLVTALQTYLDEGLAKFVKGVRLNIDSDPDVPNKTKTVGFTIKIGDLFGLISKVFANRGDDEETGDEFEAEETEETEELQEIRNFIRGFIKQK